MSTNSKLLSPDSSPNVVAKNAGVRRVNNLPIVIFGAIMLIFMLLMMIVAMNRAAERGQYDSDVNGDIQSSNSFASLIAKDYIGGIIEPKAQSATSDAPAKSPIQGIIIERPSDLDRPPLPPSLNAVTDPSHHADIEHIRMLKRQQLEEAIKAKTNVNVIAPRSTGSSPDLTNTGAPKTREEMLAKLASVRQQIDANLREDPTAAYHARLARLRQDGESSVAGGMGAGRGDEFMNDGAPRLLDDDVGRQAQDYSRFDSAKGDARWNLDSEVKKPPTPYVLQTGFVIPATLISGINSSLPGQIMAQVSQHIYDSPIGKWRLIPQGSRLVGTYSSEVEFGQARVLVAWQRIIFPDGKTMDIGAMPGADGVGYAGFKDQVNNHYMRIFGSALIMSAIVAGSTYSQRDSGGAFGRQNAGSIMSQSLGQQLGLVTANLIRKNLNISPTLEIRPGYRFNIIVTKDMKFSKPYQSFDY
ncbi:TrbI/VirB10 family protein [Nitrosomonas ureae]|uniref:Type IV secretion system protein VirB10 n=1 Tax=Nitrosomonas ureae TaxID=44577 RepID=A0A1H9H048_9PROT|nr:TrbI/VirB10 family protein [Nitrosomonas ureae]PTQ80604.1 type IV secretion system protein VirB10 [Nitrosomonas ureae]SEQ55736.1 type IV secretion system protein VirB10 [Nitrosomonas ureae]